MYLTEVSPKVLDKLQRLFLTARKLKIYKKNYDNLPKLFKPKDVKDIQRIPFVNKKDFFDFSISTKSRYWMKSRPNAEGQEPHLPFSQRDYQFMIEAEKDKLNKMGLRKGDRFSFFDFTLNHGIPMAQAAMEMGTTYIVLEGTENIVFHDIVEKQLTVLVSNFRTLQKFLSYIQESKTKSSLRLMIIAGEKIPDFSHFRQEVKRMCGADIIDMMGTRELSAYAMSCPTHSYYHFFEDTQLVEINNLASQNNTEGEVVVTPYWRQDLPLLRFNTRDAVKLEKKKCICHFQSKWVFSRILRNTTEEIKIGSKFAQLSEIYNFTRLSFHYQYFFDKFLWRVFRPPQFFLVLMFYRQQEKLVMIVQKNQFLFLLRKRSPILTSLTETVGLGPLILPVESTIFKRLRDLAKEKVADIRYVKNSPLKKKLEQYIEAPY